MRVSATYRIGALNRTLELNRLDPDVDAVRGELHLLRAEHGLAPVAPAAAAADAAFDRAFDRKPSLAHGHGAARERARRLAADTARGRAGAPGRSPIRPAPGR